MGGGIVEAMGRQARAGLLGIHANLPATVPPNVGAALAGGGPAPAALSEQERAAFDALRTYLQNGNLVSFPESFPPGDSQNLSTTPEGRRSFSTYGIVSAPSKAFPGRCWISGS